MTIIDSSLLLCQLEQLRTDLVELAFALERGGRVDAADVAIATSARIGELCAESRGAVVTTCIKRVG